MSTTFGTDGVRGVANAELAPETALALGRAAARRLGASTFFVGRDTRVSGPMLLAALSAGIAAEGFDVIDAGVIPTPGLAWLGASHDLPVAMVSASHNPYVDNGIKLFGPGGAKLAPDVERAIERDVAILLAGDDVSMMPVPTGRDVGTILVDDHAARAYVDELVATAPVAPNTLRIVCDCANGAASALAPDLFSAHGLDVVLIANTPDGTNINDRCGATAPQLLAQTVRREGADLGVSFDGDADRLIACDSTGTVVDGDVLLALFAADLDAQGMLADRRVVTTVMSNVGLRRALEARGIEVVEVDVGDRFVTDAMDSTGASLGGEQSGHIVFRRPLLAGDGLYSALRLIDLVARAGTPLSDLAEAAMTRMPQLVHNVVVKEPTALEACPRVFARASELERELGRWGRVFIRASGTEPRVRIMVEGERADDVRRVVDELSALVESELDAP